MCDATMDRVTAQRLAEVRGIDWWADYSDDAAVRAAGTRARLAFEDRLAALAATGPEGRSMASQAWDGTAPAEFGKPLWHTWGPVKGCSKTYARAVSGLSESLRIHMATVF